MRLLHHPPQSRPPQSAPAGVVVRVVTRVGGHAGGREGKESRSLSQPTLAAKAMVEEEEDDFVRERLQRISDSQVWRIGPLFELFLDDLALVWLFF